uniref:BTB domain-containing protein n=1 Tax=Trichuris muris TaxID=70415 RepID=A0A5S6QZV7_TRIMR
MSLGSASSSVSLESTSSACSNVHEESSGSNYMNFSGDDGLVHITEKHGDDLVNWMNILRRNDQLCDVTLVVSNRQIRGHRVLLASIGGIISELLLSNQRGPIFSIHDSMNENGYSAQRLSHAGSVPSFKMYTNEHGLFLELPTVDFECMEALVNFAYSGRLIVPKANVSGLYDLACLLHCDPVARVCAEYLCANLCITNCISTRKCANRFNDNLLANLVDQYIQDHFESIIQESREFSALPHILVKIISDKGQNIDWKLFNEKYMGDKLLEWFQQRVRELPAHMEFRMDILSEKPLACYFDEGWNLHDCFDADDTSSVGSCDLVQEFKRSTQKLYCTSSGEGGNPSNGNGWRSCQHTAMNGHSSSSSDCEEIEWKIVTLYKITDVTFTGIFLIKRQMAVITVELVSHENARPRTPPFLLNVPDVGRIRLARMTTPRCACGVVVAMNRLIVIGGYNRMECLTNVESYDPTKNQWNAVNSLLVKRSHLNAALCNGKVYAVGGSDGSTDLASVEQWDPCTDGLWRFVAPLPSARSSMGVVTVDDYVYCIGGCDGRNVFNECLKYSSSSNSWETVASLNVCRAEMACVAWKDRIYAIGGCDAWNKLHSVEYYSVRQNKWFEFLPLHTARRGCSAAILNDKLYVVGGTDGVQSLDSVECIDLNSDEPAWHPAPIMNSRRANVRVVVFEDRLFAVGGFDGDMFLNSIEYLESGEKEWKKFK